MSDLTQAQANEILATQARIEAGTPKPTAVLEIIDVDMAKTLLELNVPHQSGVAGTNRPLKPRHVERLRKAILAGEWVCNNQAIGISADDVLIDGQHRLTALVKAGETDPDVTIESWVIWNCDPKSMMTVDIGAHKGATDFMGMLGIGNGSQIAAALRLVWVYDNVPYDYRAWKSTQFTPVHLEELTHKHRDLVENHYAGHGVMRLITPSAVSAGLYLIRRDRPDLVELLPRFLEPLKTGANLGKGSPILALRDWSLNAGKQQRRRDGVMMLVLFLRAFNHWVEDKKVQSLRWSDTEPFAGLTKKEFYPR